MQLAKSDRARRAYSLVGELQAYFATNLGRLTSPETPFINVSWLRAEGKFGGGNRLMAPEKSIFNRASVNVSQVQYDQDPAKNLNSATAISTIVHPDHPLAPSLHLHISWTEFKDGSGYWRIMADLNPSHALPEDQQQFKSDLARFAGQQYTAGAEQGEKYFFIPALNQHRGVAHFYLEGFNTGDFDSDFEFARHFGRGMMDCYLDILEHRVIESKPATSKQMRQQIEYHTLYFFQVLTLDRGTTAGLLVHNENDVGILGSLPRYIDANLLKSWQSKVADEPRILVNKFCACLPEGDKILIDDAAKLRLCDVIRKFYGAHPTAMDFLARGDTLPQSNLNHK